MKLQHKLFNAAMTLIASGAIHSAVFAQTPPQPVIDGCSGLSTGDSCNFVTPKGMQSGFCAMMDTVLACDPNAASGGTMTTTTVPIEIGTLIGNTGGTLPDTGQTYCYGIGGSAISCPAAGGSAYGQDAQYQGNALSYTNNGDGTVSDNVTGLMWQQTTDSNGDGSINVSDKMSLSNARTYCDNLVLGGHSDWWLPDIKQMYSLIDFDGEDVSNYTGTDTTGLKPFIYTDYFAFGYGDTNAGERIIDAQYASNTEYVSTIMNGIATMFGVNFADGRIKGYPITPQRADKTYYVMCTRGNNTYGQNNFSDNGDGTISDSGSGLMWAQDDSAVGMTWGIALAWVEQKNVANYLGYNDWRLPNIKELQSLVDYSRSPDTTRSAAINPLFNATAITNEAGVMDYPYYWSSTTHLNNGMMPGINAAYVSFGRAIGSLDSGSTWLDVHGAGAQRSDPKTGDSADYPQSYGPQGDAQRVFNYVRLVRTAETTSDPGSTTDTSQCAVYHPIASPSLSVPCVDVSGTLYRADMNIVSAPELRFAVDMNSLHTVSTTAGTDCAAYSYDGSQNRLRLSCVDVNGAKLWAELDLVPDATGIVFDLTDFGNR